MNSRTDTNNQRECFVYQWCCEERPDQTVMRAYGLDKDTLSSVCLRIENFTPYVYVELTDSCDECYITATIFDLVVGTRVVEKQRLYNYGRDRSNGGGSFLFCRCKSRKYINDIVYRLKNKKVVCHEQSATSVLQLLCLRDLDSVGWLRYEGSRVTVEEDRVTTCVDEYVVQWQRLFRGCACIQQPTFKTMAFDLEVNSEVDTSLPADRPGDVVFQISCVIEDIDRTVKKILLTIEGVDNVSNELTDVDVRQFRREEQLLIGFIQLLKDERPNVLVGYNIFGFDITYLLKRYSRYFLTEEFKLAGFNVSQPADEKIVRWSSSAFSDQNYVYVDWEGIVVVDLLPVIMRDYKLDNYKLQTVATHFLNASKDPFTHKDIFAAYRNRTMAGVGKYCVKDSQLCLDLVNHLHCIVSLCEMAKICNVNIATLYTQGQQIKIYSQVYKHCQKRNILVDNSEMYVARSNERYVGAQVFEPVPGYYERVVPFDFSSLYPSIIIAYNICYSTIVTNPNVPDTDCNVFEWEDHVGCEHDPQVVKYKQLSESIDNIELQIKNLMRERDNFKQRTCKRCNQLKKATVGCVTVTMYALCGSCTNSKRQRVQEDINKLRDSQRPLRVERQALHAKREVADTDEDSMTVDDAEGGSAPIRAMCATRRYRFLKPEIKKGVIPNIIKDMLDARKIAKDNLKTCTVESEKIVYDKKQLAYKVSANSMYGAMGVSKGYLPFMPGAMCITYVGRCAIEKTADIIRTKYGGVIVYGDTDSNYVIFEQLTSIPKIWDYAIEIADRVSAEFPPPMRLEFERTIFKRYIIFKKKKYMYQTCDRDGTVDKTIGKRGVILARRDNSNVLRYLYESVASLVFDRVDVRSVIDHIVDRIDDMFRNVIPYEEYVITKSVKNTVDDEDDKGRVVGRLGSYKVKTLPDDEEEKARVLNGRTEREYLVRCCPAHVQLAERMIKRGMTIDPGSRIEYVVLDLPGAQLMADKIEEFEYFKQRSRYLKVDKLYYLKSFVKPIDEILHVGIGHDNFMQKQLQYRKNYNCLISEFKQIVRNARLIK